MGATRLIGIIAAALLAAVATAIAGPISFIGLAVPHMIFALMGEDFRWRIPAALVGGALALVAADIHRPVLIRPRTHGRYRHGIHQGTILVDGRPPRGGDEMTQPHTRVLTVGQTIAVPYQRRQVMLWITLTH